MPRFPRSTSSMLSFPRFSGLTSRLVLANVVVFFALLFLQFALPQAGYAAISLLALRPADVLHGEIWQLLTYSFINAGVLHVAFNMLTLWFIGSFLENAKGSRWLLEAYLLSAVGGAVIGCALCYTHLLGSNPASVTTGSDAALFGILAAFAVLFGDLEMMMFPLPFGIKARYLIIVYMLIEVAFLLSGGPRLTYFTILGGALLGFLYARRAPRRAVSASVGRSVSERLFGIRNNYYRWKRRRAARKFEVYMRKQNRDVRFDDEGRYIDPDEPARPNGKSNGRSRMN